MIIFYTDDYVRETIIHGRLSEKNRIYKFRIFGDGPESEWLGGLIPNPEFFPNISVFSEDTESDFDYWYWKQITDNPLSFAALMSIMLPEYEDGANNIIFIKTMDTAYRGSVTESLILFLNGMFGIDARLCMTLDDIASCPELLRPSNFSREGLMRMGEYIERYRHLGNELNPTWSDVP